MRRARRTVACLACLAAAATQAQPRTGQTLAPTWRVGWSVEHSDNMARQSVPVAETALTPSLGFAWRTEGADGRLDAAGNVAYRHYVDGRFDDEWVGKVGARGTWVLAPERFRWELESVLGTQPIDAFASDRPDNRQRTTVLRTGPSLSLRPSARWRVSADLLATRTAASTTREFDGDRLSLGMRSDFSLDPRTDLQGALVGERVAWDAATATDYRRLDALVRWTRRGASGEWGWHVGGARVDFDARSGPRGRSSPVFGARLARDLREGLRLDVEADAGLADSAGDLLAAAPVAVAPGRAPPPSEFRGATLSADLFRQRGVRIGLAGNGATDVFRLDGQWRRQRFLRDIGFDQSLRGLSVGYDRRIRASWSIGARASVEWRDYPALGREDRDELVGVHAEWRFSRPATLRAEFVHGRRVSTDPLQRFDENRALVSLVWVR